MVDYLILPGVVRKINDGKELFMYLESLMLFLANVVLLTVQAHLWYIKQVQ